MEEALPLNTYWISVSKKNSILLRFTECLKRVQAQLRSSFWMNRKTNSMLAGLSLVANVAQYLYPDLDTSQTPEYLNGMIQDGNSGAKAGRGFFDWTPERSAAVVAERNQEVIRHLKRLRARRGTMEGG